MEKLITKNFLGQNMEFYGCKSCAISNHQITNLIDDFIYDDGFVNVIADPEVPIKGFMIVGIKPHVSKLTELTPEQRGKIFEVINKLEVCMNELGENKIIKFEDGYSSHWRQWVIPSLDNFYYNQRIFESDEKSKTKCKNYYENYCILLLDALINENFDIDKLQEIRRLFKENKSIENITEQLNRLYGKNINNVLSKLKDLNMNFGRGKNLKNITNYAKIYATEDEKKQVVEFSKKLRKKFYELY